jgi:hypothetical protein
MKAHIILDRHIAEVLHPESQDLIICGKDVAKMFSSHENIIELSGAFQCEKLEHFSIEFKQKFFEKFEDNTFVLSQVNDIFKFIMVDLFEIISALRQRDVTEITLYEGHKSVHFLSVFLAANTEVSNPLFSTRSRILNPLIFDWLKNQSALEVNWRMENSLKLRLIRFIRNCFLVSASLYTIIRVVGNSRPKNCKHIAVYRTRDQLTNLSVLDSIVDKINFVQGPNSQKFAHSRSSNFITFKDLISCFFVTVKHKFLLSFKGKSKTLSLNLFDEKLSIPECEIEREASSIISSFAYEYALARLAKDNPGCIFFSSEMSSRFAVIEKRALCTEPLYTGKVVGIQFITMGSIKVPFFPVQDFLLSKSSSEHKSLQVRFSGADIKYFGNLSLLTLIEKQRQVNEENVVSFFTQPYGQEDNLRIIQTIEQCLPTNWKLILRLHPRDSATYQIDHTTEYDRTEHFSNLLVRSKIVVAKSSSVLVDAHELRKGVASVCLDSYSRQIASSMLSAEQLVRTLEDFKVLLKKLFSESSATSLSSDINELCFDKMLFLESLKDVR